MILLVSYKIVGIPVTINFFQDDGSILRNRLLPRFNPGFNPDQGYSSPSNQGYARPSEKPLLDPSTDLNNDEGYNSTGSTGRNGVNKSDSSDSDSDLDPKEWNAFKDECLNFLQVNSPTQVF